ncbi:MAG: DNA ligase [Deltaproteobacteria bacterium CG17_big_fil_post_rev_8_21_14_2_50_63_7]|nr:MAG: DNA ligase [Deltaproteobacteria bacterium CG17_big_fil_post_rev_8_21_14_2_50_63_7]
MSEKTDLRDGEVAYLQGSAALPYALKNIGGVFSCPCPAWRNQSRPIDRRTCKHLKALRGEEVEFDRIGEPSEWEKAREKRKATSANPDAAKDIPALLLAHSWDGEVELKGWWMSEKLDGVRAYWNGERFLSRAGNAYLAPAWFVEGLGPEPLDGELWIGRGLFQKTVSVVRRADGGEAWRGVRYVVFDLPASVEPFEARMARLRARFDGAGHAHVDVLEQVPCEGKEHLQAELARVEGLAGEGLMMREPGSRYVAGRSTTLLKIKSFLDAEARILEHLPGAGRHKGRLGALRVELPDGITFSVGTGLSDAEREAPPALGEIITFRYQELSTDGVPRFPSYVGVRTDFVWPASKSKNTPRAAAPKESGTASTLVAQPTPTAASGEGWTRTFELVDDKSAKFWEVAVNGACQTVRYGRIGTDGQSKTTAFPSASAAQADAEKAIVGKTKKGYVER